MKRWAKLFGCLVVASLLVALLLPSCAPVPPEAKEPIKIGSLFSHTGGFALFGRQSSMGIEVALEEVGYEVAGRPIELITEDAATDVSIAMAKVRKLVETDKVALIVGPVHSACAAAIAPYLAKMDVPGLAPSRHGKSIPLESKSIWLTAGLLGQLSYAMGIYAYEELGYRTATTLAADYVAGWEYNEGFVRGFEDSGGKVIQKQWYPLGTLDLMPYIINVEDADVFAFWGCGGTQISALRQFKEQELWKRMPIVLSSWCGFGAPAMLKEEGDTAVGIITETGWDSCIDVPGSEEFAKAFKDKFDELPDAYAGLAYVAMQIAFDAIERTGGDTSYEALAKALDETDMDTIRGHVVFTPDRVAICSCFIIQCEKMVGEEHILKHLATYTVSADRVYDDFVYKLVK